MKATVKAGVGWFVTQDGSFVEIVGRSSLNKENPWVGTTKSGGGAWSYLGQSELEHKLDLVRKLDGPPPEFQPPKEPEWLPLSDTQLEQLVGCAVRFGGTPYRSLVIENGSGKVLVGQQWVTAEQLLADWTHLDGTPVGRRADG